MSSSPGRKRSSLVGGSGKFGASGGTSGTSGVSPAGLSRQSSSTSGYRKAASTSTSRGAWPYAPRSARYRLSEVRETIGTSHAHFAQALSSETAPVSHQQLVTMEAGFALVPTPVLARAEALEVQHHEELARQAAAREPTVLIGGDYPYQEPMEGVDYQVAPSRFLGGVGGTKAMSREARKDELVFAPRAAAAAGVRIDAYIEQARALVATTDTLHFSEEVALSILHDLRYSSDAALAALKQCVAWQRPPQPPDGGGQGTSSPAAMPRAAAANSVLWLQRLRAAAKRSTWSAGECEALDAGIADYGKELATMHGHVLREKTLPQVIEMYYVIGWRHQSP